MRAYISTSETSVEKKRASKQLKNKIAIIEKEKYMKTTVFINGAKY